MNPFRPIVTVALQRQSVRLKKETDRASKDGETAMGGGYATQHVVLTPGAEYAATGMALTALTDRIHFDKAIPPRPNYSLLKQAYDSPQRGYREPQIFSLQQFTEH
jgi:hypothetical protein